MQRRAPRRLSRVDSWQEATERAFQAQPGVRSPQLWLLRHECGPREGKNGLDLGLWRGGGELAVWAWP